MVKSYKECLDAIVELSGKIITRADAADLLRKVGTATSETMAKEQAFRSLADITNDLVGQQVSANQWVDMSNKLMAMKTAIVHETELANMNTHLAEGGTVSSFIKNLTMRGGSVERAAVGMKEMFIAPIATALEKNALADVWADNAQMSEIVRALFSGAAPENPRLKIIYDLLNRTVDTTRVLANEMGVPVDQGPLSLLSANSFTTSDIVATKSVDEFVAFFSQLVEQGHIDKNRLVLPRKEGATGREVVSAAETVAEYARRMYERLVDDTDKINDFNTTGYLANSGKINNLHRRIGAMQTIPFTTADGFLAWHEAFSDRTLGEAMWGRINQLGGNLGLMQRLGPNPGNTILSLLRTASEAGAMTNAEKQFFLGQTPSGAKNLKQLAKENLQGLGKGLIDQPHPGALLAAVTGDLDVPSNPFWAAVTSTAMSVTSAYKLALGVFSQAVDIAPQAHYLAKQWNINQLETVFNNFRALMPNATEKELLSNIGLTAQATMDALRNVNGSFSYVPAGVNSALNLAYKLNFMPKVDRAMRTSAATLIQNTIFTAKTFTPEMLSELSPYGLTQEVIDQLRPYVKKVGQYTLLDTSAIPVEMSGITSRFTAAMNDYIINAVTTPTAAQRASMSSGLRAGTPMGNISRLLFHFKSFPIAMSQRTIPRVRDGLAPGMSGIVEATALIASAYALWYVSDSAKQYLLNREPKNPFDLDSIAMGVAYTGVFGIGETVIPKEGDTGSRFIEGLAGPTLSTGAKVVTGLGGAAWGIKDSVETMSLSPDIGRGLGRAAKELTPYPLVHAILTNRLTRTLFMDTLAESVMGIGFIEDEFDLADKQARNHYNTYGKFNPFEEEF